MLRNDDTSAALRKRDMIHLTRLWGYRCHIWRCDARRSHPHVLLRRCKAFTASPLTRLPVTQAAREPAPLRAGGGAPGGPA